MAKFTFKDILTKVSNVFKNDMYIIDYQFCLGGKESEDFNRSTLLCVLTPELMELVKEQFPENKKVQSTLKGRSLATVAQLFKRYTETKMSFYG